MLRNSDIIALTQLRRLLHQHPEISGQEVETAARIAAELHALGVDRVLTGLGGHGVAGVIEGASEGPTVLFRAELDALPIQELDGPDWISTVPGKGHLCGHDGHMVMLLGLGRVLMRDRPKCGRVVLMFQPAEEDGSGARAVVADPAFAEVSPDWAFAIHNEPGRSFGTVSARAGLMNCASQGLKVTLSGKTAHAADPEDGVSPAPALAELIPGLTALGAGGALDEAFRLVTVTHVSMGAPTFGIAPGEAVIFATLRTGFDGPMADLSTVARQLCEGVAAQHGLKVGFEVEDDFAASINDPEATDIAERAMEALGIAHGDADLPMRASEDFGVFGWSAKAAMLCLGPGEDHAALHNPDYDFPDDLIPIGVSIFEQIARDLLGSSQATK
jgi:amidohydrolase